jgi:hypothetical protein
LRVNEALCLKRALPTNKWTNQGSLSEMAGIFIFSLTTVFGKTVQNISQIDSQGVKTPENQRTRAEEKGSKPTVLTH